MTWREDLRRVSFGGREMIGASFRGVPFFVDSSERSGGRRLVVHEFPLRDDPFVEDLGRRARPFRIEGYVIGDDYLAQKDALLSALEDVAGPGELVHPYHGVRRAACANFSVRESRTEGGAAQFAMEFAEAPAQSLVPVEAVDTAGQVAATADTAATAAASDLASELDVSGLPAFAVASSETAVAKTSVSLKDRLSSVATSGQELADLAGRLTAIGAEASYLVRNPLVLLSRLREAIIGMVDARTASPGEVMTALALAYRDPIETDVPVTTATRARELENQRVLTGALRRIIAVEAAALAPLVSYRSIEEATAAREQIASMLEEQAAGAGDAAYPALVSLRSAVLRAVPGGRAFARVVAVERGEPVSSLLLSYQLYGSVDMEADIIGRNRGRVAHPGFISGSLRVLSDV